MKKHVVIFFFVLGYTGFAQTTDTVRKHSKTQPAKIETELKISLKQLKEAVTVRDLIPGIPTDCKIGQCDFIETSASGKIHTGTSTNGADVQRHILAKDTKSLYVTIKSSCTAYNKTFKLTVE